MKNHIHQNRLFAVLAGTISVLTLAGPIPGIYDLHAAPVQWIVGSGANGHYYEVFYSTGIDWQAASNSAVALGGYLVTITSAEENAFVFNLANNPAYWFTDGANNSEGPWLGGFQPPGAPEPAGNWQWVNGEGSFGFTSWSPGEPNNSGGTEDRLVFFALGPNNRSSNWNDVTGSSTQMRGYVVEWTDLVAPVQLQAPQRNAGEFSFCFATISNRSYTVQSSTNLAFTNWSLCTNVIGDGSTLRVSTPATNMTQQFFRVCAP